MKNREKTKTEDEYMNLLFRSYEINSLLSNNLDSDGRKKLEFELLRNGSRRADLHSIIRKNNITSCGEKT